MTSPDATRSTDPVDVGALSPEACVAAPEIAGWLRMQAEMQRLVSLRAGLIHAADILMRACGEHAAEVDVHVCDHVRFPEGAVTWLVTDVDTDGVCSLLPIGDADPALAPRSAHAHRLVVVERADQAAARRASG